MDARGGEGGGSIFAVGDKVVCVDVRPCPHFGPPLLRLRAVYTVRRVWAPALNALLGYACAGIELEEVLPQSPKGFGAFRFVHAIPRSDAFLTSCLKAAHEPLFTRVPIKTPAHSDTGVG